MTSPAPKRRLDPPRVSHRKGKRAASRRGVHRFFPSPAVVGTLVLALAGAGAVGFSPQLDSDAVAAGSQNASTTYGGSDSGAVDGTAISRNVSEQRKQEQIQAQAEQLQRIVDDDSTKVQKRADELEKDEAKKRDAEKRKSKKKDSNQWVLPVTGYNLSARFGESSGMWSSTHTGLDFAGPSGSKIVSVAAGKVKSTESSGAYGNRTIIELDDGTEIWYAHQSEMSVSPGDKVEPGDAIGKTGSTGNVTGPHLHLEVHPNGGDAVDPEKELSDHNVDP